MLNPFIDLFAAIIHLYLLCVIAWAVFSVLISFKIINAYQPIVQRVMYALDRLVQPALRPMRKYIPDLGSLDITPILLILLLQFLQNALYTYFYNIH